MRLLNAFPHVFTQCSMGKAFRCPLVIDLGLGSERCFSSSSLITRRHDCLHAHFSHWDLRTDAANGKKCKKAVLPAVQVGMQVALKLRHTVSVASRVLTRCQSLTSHEILLLKPDIHTLCSASQWTDFCRFRRLRCAVSL